MSDVKDAPVSAKARELLRNALVWDAHSGFWPTPVPVGTPKTGFMIESMVTAAALNIGKLLRGQPADSVATWNAVCLADFGDGGVAFVAQPQIPPRNVSWSAKGAWVHLAKVAFEKYFLRKMRAGASEPFFESFLLRRLDIHKLRKAG